MDKVLARVGLANNLSAGSAEERVLSRYYDRLDVYAVDKTRVLVVDFTSIDPDLAALGANTVAEEYILLQQSAKRDINADATKWLQSQIADLRVRVENAQVHEATLARVLELRIPVNCGSPDMVSRPIVVPRMPGIGAKR